MEPAAPGMDSPMFSPRLAASLVSPRPQCCPLPVRMHVRQVWDCWETAECLCVAETSDPVSHRLDVWDMRVPVWELGWCRLTSHLREREEPGTLGSHCLAWAYFYLKVFSSQMKHRKPVSSRAPSNSSGLAPQRALSLNVFVSVCWAGR